MSTIYFLTSDNSKLKEDVSNLEEIIIEADGKQFVFSNKKAEYSNEYYYKQFQLLQEALPYWGEEELFAYLDTHGDSIFYGPYRSDHNICKNDLEAIGHMYAEIYHDDEMAYTFVSKFLDYKKVGKHVVNKYKKSSKVSSNGYYILS